MDLGCQSPKKDKEVFYFMDVEIFKPIPNYEGHYEVSNFGNVRSLKFGKLRILKPCTVRAYGSVVLLKGNSKTYPVHQLVAMAFLGHIPNGNKGLVVNHIDNNPKNNNLTNLELITHRENATCHKPHKGLHLFKRDMKWHVQLRINNTKLHLGYYSDFDEASRIRETALNNTHLFNGIAKEFKNNILMLDRKKTKKDLLK